MSSWLDDVPAPDLQQSSASVRDIAESALALQAARDEVERLEGLLTDAKEVARKLEQETIPGLLTSAGVSAVKIPGVGEVSAKLAYKASVPEAQWPAFKLWAKDNGLGDVIKEPTILENAPDAIKRTLADLGAMFETRPAMHWQTLAKIAREQATKGEDFPACLSVYTYYQTNIKR